MEIAFKEAGTPNRFLNLHEALAKNRCILIQALLRTLLCAFPDLFEPMGLKEAVTGIEFAHVYFGPIFENFNTRWNLNSKDRDIIQDAANELDDDRIECAFLKYGDIYSIVALIFAFRTNKEFGSAWNAQPNAIRGWIVKGVDFLATEEFKKWSYQFIPPRKHPVSKRRYLGQHAGRRQIYPGISPSQGIIPKPREEDPTIKIVHYTHQQSQPKAYKQNKQSPHASSSIIDSPDTSQTPPLEMSNLRVIKETTQLQPQRPPSETNSMRAQPNNGNIRPAADLTGNSTYLVPQVPNDHLQPSGRNAETARSETPLDGLNDESVNTLRKRMRFTEVNNQQRQPQQIWSSVPTQPMQAQAPYPRKGGGVDRGLQQSGQGWAQHTPQQSGYPSPPSFETTYGRPTYTGQYKYPNIGGLLAGQNENDTPITRYLTTSQQAPPSNQNRLPYHNSLLPRKANRYSLEPQHLQQQYSFRELVQLESSYQGFVAEQSLDDGPDSVEDLFPRQQPLDGACIHAQERVIALKPADLGILREVIMIRGSDKGKRRTTQQSMAMA
ncbi:hypothetical protein G7Y89_g2731 [Cudoniella acicularis]|uniref:Uncharacterized protein n=1 Tax=Cudoniella acicularis TaxID=354080 RepID=A0A8H4RUP5_9HELO|nr:hypothetical protein G7Y89_g2731 [Cudoniella acicularis]